jgi:hypothetical protein
MDAQYIKASTPLHGRTGSYRGKITMNAQYIKASTLFHGSGEVLLTTPKKHGMSENRKGIMYVRAFTAGMSQSG